MDLRSIQDWTIVKELKSVPDIVDVSTFGGTTREYQVRVDPNKLVSYGLSIGQVEQQLANNNINAGGNFVETGLQQMNVRTIGLFTNVKDIEQTVLTTKSGTPLRVKDIAEVAQGAESSLGARGQGHPSRGRRDRGQRRCHLRPGDDAQGRGLGADAGGAARQGGPAQQRHSASRREDGADDRSQRSAAVSRWARSCTTWAKG